MALSSPWWAARLVQKSKSLPSVVISTFQLKDKLPTLHHLRYSSDVATPVTPDRPSSNLKPTTKAITISKAMKAYIERVKAHDDMMKAEVAEYEIGKRHLANIMGVDPDNFTKKDIDQALGYLLPSGLFQKGARPVMKDPYEIFPKRKAAQFGSDGRPHHWLYFTTLPNYYNILYDIAWNMEALKLQEDELRAQKKFDELEGKALYLLDSEWVSEKSFSAMISEKVPEKEYKHFIVLMERLAAHPLSQKEEAFLMKYRNMLQIQSQTLNISQIELDSDGRSYSSATGNRGHAEASVRVYKPGTGQVTINNTDISYFKQFLCRETIINPLILTNLIGAVDIVANVQYGGPTRQAGAIRLAVSNSLLAFVDDATKEQMRLSGLLTSDPRLKERKKPGQPKARKKFTWKRR